MNSNASTDSSSVSPSPADAISRRAYELWEQAGRPEGNDVGHWLQAERELAGGSTSGTAATRYTDQPQARPAPSDSRPLQGQATRPPGTSNREGKRTSASPFSGEKSAGNGGGAVAAKRRV